MELSQLRSFLKVAEEGSVTRAAESLHLTQPAITQHIRALEREAGAALFERTGRGMRLTGSGELLCDYARKALAAIEDGQRVIADEVQGRAGRLILAAGVTTSIFHLPRWLQAFRKMHPGVDIAVRTGRSKEVARMALDREIDLGLVTSPVPHPDLEAVPLFDEEIVLVAPPEQAHSQPVTLATMAATPLILFPQGTGFRAYLDQVLAEAGAAAPVKMETDSVESIKSFVQVGLGMSFLPLSAVQAEMDSGLLARVNLAGIPPLKRTTAVVRRKDRYLGVAARDFLAIARA